jgi:hypothetical protein
MSAGGGRVEIDRFEVGIGAHARVSDRGEPRARLDHEEVADGGAGLGLRPCFTRGQRTGQRDPGGGARRGGMAQRRNPHLTIPNLPTDVPIPGASTWNT